MRMEKKKYKQYLLLILMFVINKFLFAQFDSIPKINLSHFLTENTKVYHKKNDIPYYAKKAFRENMRKVGRKRFRIVNPGKKYMDSDVLEYNERKRSTRRLNFILKKNDECIICYEKGGYAHYVFVLYIKKGGALISIDETGIIKTYKDSLKKIAEGTYNMYSTENMVL